MRYTSNLRTMTTDLDKYADVVGWIEGLRSRQYLTDVLRERHGVTNPSVLSRKITPYIETALNYIEQAEKGPGQVAFLPLYYCMLNLAKVYILLGPKRADLDAREHRLHGVQYNPEWNDQIRLDRQKIRMQTNGVLGLFYQTLTGDPWITAPTNISMAKVYPYIDRVSAEYGFVTGENSHLASIELLLQHKADGWHFVVNVDRSATPHETELNYLSALRPDHWEEWDQAEGKGFSTHAVPDRSSIYDLIHCCARREMLRLPALSKIAPGRTLITCTMAIDTGFPRMVEEFPIILAFFYQASIARYKPEFLYRQFDSKLWPFLVALRRHGSFGFLLAFWSFIRQESISFVAV